MYVRRMLETDVSRPQRRRRTCARLPAGDRARCLEVARRARVLECTLHFSVRESRLLRPSGIPPCFSFIYAVFSTCFIPSSKPPLTDPQNPRTCPQNLSPSSTAGHLLRKERLARMSEDARERAGPGPSTVGNHRPPHAARVRQPCVRWARCRRCPPRSRATVPGVVREPCRRSRRRRVMRLLLPVAAFVLLVSAAHGNVPGPPNEAAVIATGRAPCGLAAFGGELWVGVYEAGTALRLDRAGRVQRRHRVGRWACQVAVDQRRPGLRGTTRTRSCASTHFPGD